MYVLKSVPQPQNTSAGAPTPKDRNITIFDANDVLAWPAPDANGVNLLGNFVMKPGAKMHQLYMTPSKQAATFESDGDEDAVGITQKFEGSFPGDTVEIREFVKNNLGRNLIIVYGSCRDTNKTVCGTKCSPMKLQPSFTSNGDGTMHTLVFTQYMKTDQVPYNYTGTLEFAEPFASPLALPLLKANGTSYQLAEEAAGAAIDVASLDLDHGTVVSLIGGGGADPGILSGGASVTMPAVTVVLKDNTDWTALKNATISLEVFKADATTYLIERSRS